MYERGILVIGIALIAAGATLCALGAWASHELTGEWRGPALPTAVLAAWGLGLLSGVFGLLMCLGYGLLLLLDRSGIRNVLYAPVASDHSLIARFGRTVLQVKHAWDMVIGVAVLVMVAWAATQEATTALILVATAGLVLVVYWFARPRPTDRAV